MTAFSSYLFLNILHLTTLLDAETTVNTYGTFESIGISIDTNDDPSQLTTPTFTYKLSSDTEYINGHEFTRVNINRWVTSIFQAKPNSDYNIKISFTGGTLNAQERTHTQSTRDYLDIQLASQTVVNSYIISPTGSDASCNITTPCTWETAYGLLQSNDEIVFTNGTYFLGGITLSISNIILRGNSNDNVVINGAFEQTYYTWILVNGLNNIYETTITNLGTPYGIVANEQRLFPYSCLDTGCTLELNTLSLAGIPGFYYTGNILYIKFVDSNIDPNAIPFEISQYGFAFTPSANTYFYNIKFKNYGQGEYAKAIYINGVSNVIVKNCTFIHNNVGIGVKRQYDNVVIDGNTFIDTRFEFKWEAVKASGWLESGGFVIYSSNEDGQGLVVMNNIFYGYFDCMNPGASQPNNLLTNELDIYNNIMYECADDGMSSDGYCSNCRIWNNTIYESLTAISLAPVYDGPIYIFRNVMYHLGVGNSDAGYSGLSFKTNSGYDSSGYMYIYHNTIDNTQLDNEYGIWFKGNGDWENIVIRNNIFLSTSYVIHNSNIDPVDFDYDCLYSTQQPLNEIIRWMSVEYGLNDFQTSVEQEQNAIYYMPTFVDFVNNDYHLDSVSDVILIDSAQVIDGIEYSGNGADFGAFEYVDMSTESPTIYPMVTETTSEIVSGSPTMVTETTTTVEIDSVNRIVMDMKSLAVVLTLLYLCWDF
eukprot:524447_1